MPGTSSYERAGLEKDCILYTRKERKMKRSFCAFAFFYPGIGEELNHEERVVEKTGWQPMDRKKKRRIV